MDEQRLDTLAKVIGRWMTRRSVVASIAGMGLAASTLAVTRAKPKTKKSKKGKKGKCKLHLPQTQCRACPRVVTYACKKRIRVGCPPQPDGTGCSEDGGTACCAGSCRNLQSDVANCGSCGNACASHQTCQAGVCVP